MYSLVMLGGAVMSGLTLGLIAFIPVHIAQVVRAGWPTLIAMTTGVFALGSAYALPRTCVRWRRAWLGNGRRLQPRVVALRF